MREGIADFSSQRPAIDVAPPALTRHVTFRLPTKHNPRSGIGQPDVDAKWEALLAVLNRHLAKVRSASGAEGGPGVTFKRPSERSNAPGDYNLSRTAIVKIFDRSREGGCRLRVRVDVYTEMFSLTYLLDAIAPEAAAGQRFAQLQATPANECAGKALTWLYEAAWTADGALPCKDGLPPWCDDPDLRDVGSLLADFRGVVLKLGVRSLSDEPADRLAQPRLAPGLQTFLVNHERGLISHALGGGPEESRSWNAGEPVLCGMLGGEALYAATLGRQMDDHQPEPVRHLLVFDQAPPAQIGRLVRRLHILGEFRHAALMDYDNNDGTDLKEVSRALKGLGPKLDAELTRSSETDATCDISGLIGEVGKLKISDTEGLTYRIEQSRYYATQFRKTVPQLRSLGIRHYQSYDDFVARYIYQLFARIDRLGNRYDGFLRRLNLLISFRLSREIEGYQTQVKTALLALQGTVTSLTDATDGVRKASGTQIEAIGNVQEAIGKVQEVSERQIDVVRKQEKLLREAALLGLLIAIHYTGETLLEWYDVPAFFAGQPIVPKQWFLTIYPLLVLVVFVLVVGSFLLRTVFEARDRTGGVVTARSPGSGGSAASLPPTPETSSDAATGA